MIELLKQNKQLYDLFTRQEEYNSLILDKYQRFPYCLSKYRDILEPEVSKFLIKNGLKVEYPDNKKFAVCLTHDIDSVYFSKRGITSSAFNAIINGRIKNGLKIVFSKLNKKWNPWWNFNEIMALENRYGAKSSFYFLALSKENFDFNFNIEDLNSDINNAADNGWEIGLHGGHEAYNSLDEIMEEKYKLETVLGREVIGYRNHFLRFKVPDTWELLSQAGFKYDSTFGYADCAGFRNGMCHPFKPFNLDKDEEIDILEIPLIVMDSTLFEYMRLNMQGAWEIIKRLIDTVEKYNGVITILWHNTYMTNENLRFYEQILKYCNGKNALMTSGEEIFNFWGENNG